MWGSSAAMHFSHTGVQRTPVGPSQVYVAVSPSLWLYLCRFFRVTFWQTSTWPLIARSACGRRPRFPQYNLYSIIICRSVCLSGRPRAFYYFCICINFQCGVLAPRCIYSQTRVRRTLVGSSQAYVPVCMYVCFSAW